MNTVRGDTTSPPENLEFVRILHEIYGSIEDIQTNNHKGCMRCKDNVRVRRKTKKSSGWYFRNHAPCSRQKTVIDG